MPLPGFPAFHRSLAHAGPLLYDADDDGREEVLLATYDGEVLFFQADSKFLKHGDGGRVSRSDSGNHSSGGGGAQQPDVAPVASWGAFNDSKIALFPKWQVYWCVLRGGYISRYREKIAEDVYSKYERPASDPVQLSHLVAAHVTTVTTPLNTTTTHDASGQLLPKGMYRYSAIEFKTLVEVGKSETATTTLLFLHREEMRPWLVAAERLMALEKSRVERARLAELEREAAVRERAAEKKAAEKAVANDGDDFMFIFFKLQMSAVKIRMAQKLDDFRPEALKHCTPKALCVMPVPMMPCRAAADAADAGSVWPCER